MAIGNPITLTSNVASKTINVIATASQSLFTVTGGYRINEIAVFRNGVRLVDGRDFTARDGSTVTLLSAASEGDALEFQVFDTFRVADAITPFDSDQTIAGNLNITGILSASQLGSVNFNVTSGIQTFHDVRVGGALTVAGTLTYEDTSNSNVTGIATFSDQVSIGDSIFHTGDTDTSIRFPAADTFAVETAGSERIRIRSNGVIVKGNSGTQVTLGNGANTQLIGSGSADSSLALIRQASGGGEFYFAAGTSGTNIADDNGLGFIKFMGYHTNGYDEYARIEAFVDGTNGDGDAPGRLIFKTSADNAASPTERLRITSAGKIGINDTNPERAVDIRADNVMVQLEGTGGNGRQYSLCSTDDTTGASVGPAGNFVIYDDTSGTARLRINSSGITTIASGSFAIPSVPEANTDNAELPVLFQTQAGTVDGGSGLSYNPAGDVLSVNGLILSSQMVRTSGSNTLTLTTANGNGQSDVRVTTSSVQIFGGSSEKLAVTVGGVNITGITTATQLFEGTTRVASTGKAIAMAMLFG